MDKPDFDMNRVGIVEERLRIGCIDAQTHSRHHHFREPQGHEGPM